MQTVVKYNGCRGIVTWLYDQKTPTAPLIVISINLPRQHSTPSTYARCRPPPFSENGINQNGSELINRLFELLAEEDELDLVVDGQDTSTSDTTEDVSTSTLEERLRALLGDDLAGSVEGRVVLDGLLKRSIYCPYNKCTKGGWISTYLTRGHHHTTTDGVKRVRGNTGTGGDRPAEQERSKEVTLERTNQEDGLDGVVQSEVETTVDDDTEDGGTETTVETGNTVGSDGLAVDVNETVELTVTTALGGLGVVGKTGTGVVEGVDEEEGSGTSSLLKKISHYSPSEK